MSKIWEETECALRLAAKQMKKFYDQKHGDSHEYNPGDKVWLEGQKHPCRPTFQKAQRQAPSGPFKRNQEDWRGRLHAWSPRYLARHLGLPLTKYSSLLIFLPPPLSRRIPTRFPKSSTTREEYEIEEIISNSQLKRGCLRYLVRWKGWPREPPKNLTHADEAIDEYHKKNPAAPSPLRSLSPPFHRNAIVNRRRSYLWRPWNAHGNLRARHLDLKLRWLTARD